VLESVHSSTRALSREDGRDIDDLLKRRICTAAHYGTFVIAFNCDEIAQEAWRQGFG
jgi:hypothetical protein